jgi:uncharacterized MAPEG superfamily protein
VTIAEVAVFAAFLLIIVAIAPAKASGRRDFDNADPRNESFYRDPFRKRALGAHQNSIEAFPFFAAAVLLAEFRACPQGLINALALGFIAARCLYILAYLGDRASARSAIWSIGVVLNAAIFFLPAFRGG